MATGVVITGHREVDRMLKNLSKKEARALHRKALRKATADVLKYAKTVVPKRSGQYAKSLIVRAVPRSRKWFGFKVTQRLNYARAGREGVVTSDRDTGYYGVYQELGWRATGRIARQDFTAPRKTEAQRLFADVAETTLNTEIRTYRGALFKIGQLRKARKIQGKWQLRNAGKVSEPRARRIYLAELRSMIDREANKK